MLCIKTPVFLQFIFAVFHTNKIKYANGVVTYAMNNLEKRKKTFS